MSRKLKWIRVYCAMLMIGFSGCRSLTPSVTYYVMHAMDSGAPVSANADGAVNVTIGIRTVELPGVINRTQMVKRTSSNQLEIASFYRWADYPDRMVKRVLNENLQRIMADARVFSAPWTTGITPDVMLDFAFLELIGTTDGTMLLSTVWTQTTSGDPSTAQFHRTSLSAAINGSGFDDLADAHNRVLEALCREVAKSLDAKK